MIQIWMYQADELKNSWYDKGRNTSEHEHKIVQCFDEDNAQKDTPSHYNRAIDLSEHRNEFLTFDDNIERYFQPTNTQNKFDCLDIGASD